MRRLDIIESVNEPNEWVNPLIIVEKPDGKLRICLYAKHLNQAIKRQHYKLPTAEELFSEMHHAKCFTKLDASSAYWQIKVDEESSKLLTLSTLFGRLRFKRLPYGIHSASEVFQKDIEEIIEGCEGARNSQDDIIIWGSTLTQLDICTELVLNRIRKSGLKLNKNKCGFGATELIFLGHKISEKGISPDPEKVKAIKDMPFPSSKQDLQRFLGMIAYLSKFIPQLSEETHLLRELIKKGSIWDFTLTHRNQFDKLRSMVSENTSLKFFDPKLPTKITCDSSKFGVGATLEQKHGNVWHPVAFKSRSCTSAEQNYCPLERETLAIVFACSKFNEYLYGKKFIVESDHKPLKSILHTPIHKTPPRIQLFIMFLQKYDFVVNYVPGKDLVCSDTLSRAGPEISETEINCHVHSVISSFPMSTERLKQLEVQTLNDRTLQRVASYITQGWPKSRNHLSPELKPYYNLRDELTVVNNLILKGNKIVISSTLIKEMKQILHTGHLGIEMTKSNARSTMYWTNIDKDINEMISNCNACQKYRNLNPREPLLSYEIP